MYWPAAGRFVSADTVVPGPFSPQHYNRYLYVLGNPLRLVDPSGHVSAAQCGAITDQAQSAFCWNQRWYEAHGYSWVNGGWQAGHNPIIDDAGIGMDVLGEAGITLESEAGLSWTDDMIKSAAYGVARLGQALAGGLGRVRELLGGGATLHLVNQSPRICGGGQQACAPPPWVDIARNAGHNVYMPVGYFATTYVHMDIVHELAHVIDWSSSIQMAGYKQGAHFSSAWYPYLPITDYAHKSPTPLWDKFAEAVTVAVFGTAYVPRSGNFLVNAKEVSAQSKRVLELLNGWR